MSTRQDEEYGILKERNTSRIQEKWKEGKQRNF